MATVIAEMTTSLDGFVTDPSGSAERLHPNLAALRGTAYLNAMIERTGAVLMGRRAFVDPNGADVVNLLVDLAYAALDPRVRYTCARVTCSSTGTHTHARACNTAASCGAGGGPGGQRRGA